MTSAATSANKFDQNSLIAFLFSKCTCIQHFKLNKNRIWAINFVLISKNKNV